jgi:hypothetical protein
MSATENLYHLKANLTVTAIYGFIELFQMCIDEMKLIPRIIRCFIRLKVQYIVTRIFVIVMIVCDDFSYGLQAFVFSKRESTTLRACLEKKQKRWSFEVSLLAIVCHPYVVWPDYRRGFEENLDRISATLIRRRRDELARRLFSIHPSVIWAWHLL